MISLIRKLNCLPFKPILFLLIIILDISLSAQIVGISANKLTLLSATILPQGIFEFEPVCSVINSNKVFDENWKSLKQDGRNTASSLDFRLTAELTEQLEIGTSISSNTENINFGSKYFDINSTKKVNKSIVNSSLFQKIIFLFVGLWL